MNVVNVVVRAGSGTPPAPGAEVVAAALREALWRPWRQAGAQARELAARWAH